MRGSIHPGWVGVGVSSGWCKGPFYKLYKHSDVGGEPELSICIFTSCLLADLRVGSSFRR